MESSLNVVLIEPEIPQNTGNISRTCAATGARLHLVGPMGFHITDKQVRRAGLDYWDKLDITYYDSTEEFFEKNKDGKFFYFTTKAEQTHSEVSYPNNAYLVFGKETKGLPEELLKENHDSCVRLPMRGIIRSLNLSNAVAVGVYEVLRQWDYPELSLKGQLHNLKW
ncbi:MAG: tRNA (uridine(34)/cytosine(34)/5-carboxymethylaminomethyluridine(34)-2'-O)-methyltransferase TrmL [Eubacterium sp.]|nr:tRNA (uridine(34)/cytosine(34)/5-carboxymethylaminomethyluridine(34)-2'-O)-methyltransferase TrmL [Eubacterium sp.]